MDNDCLPQATVLTQYKFNADALVMQYLQKNADLGEMKVYSVTDYSLHIADVCECLTSSRVNAFISSFSDLLVLLGSYTLGPFAITPAMFQLGYIAYLLVMRISAQVSVVERTVLCAISIKLLCMSPTNTCVQ
jgi:hypothetical protein